VRAIARGYGQAYEAATGKKVTITRKSTVGKSATPVAVKKASKKKR